jgi:hypothetical protein
VGVGIGGGGGGGGGTGGGGLGAFVAQAATKRAKPIGMTRRKWRLLAAMAIFIPLLEILATFPGISCFSTVDRPFAAA